MANYKLSNDAKEDLKNIYRHGVKEFGQEQADEYFSALVQRFSKIAVAPYLYPAVEHIREGYRRSVCGRDSIYYRVFDQNVEIMRIIGQQDFK